MDNFADWLSTRLVELELDPEIYELYIIETLEEILRADALVSASSQLEDLVQLLAAANELDMRTFEAELIERWTVVVDERPKEICLAKPAAQIARVQRKRVVAEEQSQCKAGVQVVRMALPPSCKRQRSGTKPCHYHQVVKLNRNEYCYAHVHSRNGNTTKVVKRGKVKNAEELQRVLNQIPVLTHGILCGYSSLHNRVKLTNEWTSIPQNMSDEDVVKHFAEANFKQSNQELEGVLAMLNDTRRLHRLIYGRIEVDIKNAIEAYQVQRLYCLPGKKRSIESLLPAAYYNFKVVEVSPLNDGDAAAQLASDFGGVVAVSYR
jgi:hypothetical protein